MNKGTVKLFKNDKGFGFIIPENGQANDNGIFFHISAVNGGLTELQAGQEVTYDTEFDEKRKNDRAVNINVI